jgi:hypothetical protein
MTRKGHGRLKGKWRIIEMPTWPTDHLDIAGPCPYRKLDSRVAMVQSADHGLGNDATEARDRSANRRVLA